MIELVLAYNMACNAL